MLYKFQKQALDQSDKDYFYALDTGTGKTITSIHHYMKYSSGEPLLIVAPPQKIKEGGWERDLQQFKINQIEAAGGIAFVARDVGKVKRELDEAGII